ncbi:MAG: hypothetical protein CL946_02930 [Ectothiorhodospiraceae bacterium]|nr:hypothetical protein [Ectothiorhodospiraceae bacterium]
MLEHSIDSPFLRKLEGYGIINAKGAEALDLLNRLSTNRVVGMTQGDARETVLTNEKGRIIDVVTVLACEEGLCILTSEGKEAEVAAWLDKYTIMEDVSYSSSTDEYQLFRLYNTNGSLTVDTPGPGRWKQLESGGTELHMVAQESVTGGKYTIMLPQDAERTAIQALLEAGTEPKEPSDEEYRLWRIRNGIPAVGYELTDLVNPLESGAGKVVDFEKGCYIGQEVIARLDSYDKVQRKLRKLQFDTKIEAAIEPGTALLSGGKNAGFITSVAFDPELETTIGLGCIRNAYTAEGSELELLLDDSTYRLRVVESFGGNE